MAVEYPNLNDVLRMQDPTGKIRPATFGRILTQELPMLEDMPMIPTNRIDTHLMTLDQALPTPTYRRIYTGVEPSKGQKTQVEESCGHLEDMCRIDELVVDPLDDPKAVIASENMDFMEGFAQKWGTDIIYSDTAVNPDQPLGIAPRYDVLGTPTGKPTANNYLNQVLNAGGTTANIQTSMYLIGWGPRTVFGLYPRNTAAGLVVRDKGKIQVTDATQKTYWAYATQYLQDWGFAVKDWRYIVRIANIESTASTFDYTKLIQAVNAIPSLSKCRPVFYCNRTTRTLLDIVAAAKTNVFWPVKSVFGEEVLSFRGIPIRTHDSIVNTEAVLT